MGGCRGARIILPSLVLGFSMLSAAPDRTTGGVGKEEYRGRREALAAALRKEIPAGGSGILMLSSAPAPENLTFRQESNLYYLTGIEIPGSTLVLLFDRAETAPKKKTGAITGHYAEYLYLPARDYMQERWTGPKAGAGGLERKSLEPDDERKEAMSLTGFDRVPEGDYPPRRFPRGPVERQSDLPAHLSRFLASAGTLFYLAEPGTLGAPLPPDLTFLKQVREQYPWTVIKNPATALERMRMVKSPGELELLRRAIEITCHAHRDALLQARAGMREFQVQAIMEYRFALEGARRPGYPSIVGSGPDSCVLHYDSNDGVLSEGDLLLLDAGAEYRRYTADVTRTLPVSGTFTQEQRKVYDVVLKAQEAAIAIIHPGIPFSEIDKTARKVITDAGYGPYFIHGTSHFIGLDVHDTGDTSALLEAGMVLTVEPGIYIPERNLGIRIEDDVLVTREGSRVLSDCAPKRPDAVEMQRAEGLKSAER